MGAQRCAATPDGGYVRASSPKWGAKPSPGEATAPHFGACAGVARPGA